MMWKLEDEILELIDQWSEPRWRGARRPYTAEDVVRLRGTMKIEHTLARRGAERLWALKGSTEEQQFKTTRRVPESTRAAAKAGNGEKLTV